MVPPQGEVDGMPFDQKLRQESLQVRIEVRGSWRQAHRLHAAALQNGPKPCTKRAVPVHEQVTDSEEEFITAVSEIAGALLHPGRVRVCRAAREMELSSGQLHHEQKVVDNQSVLRPDFDRG